MKRPLIFVGSRKMMRELACIAELNNIEIIGILDHHYPNQEIAGIPVLGDERWLTSLENAQAQQWLRTCDFFPANWHNGEQPVTGQISLPGLRLERIRILEESGANVINLIHPDACIKGLTSRYANYRIGRGVQIHADVYHGIDNIEIGDYCAFMSGNTCAHDVKIGRNVLVAPETYLYNCNINDNSYVGIYSRVNPIKKKSAINIGQNVTVWNNAEVVKDIPDGCFYTSDGRIMTKNKEQ
jgi:acetyltransferase-like isoleucine patch superfamily enzyme